MAVVATLKASGQVGMTTGGGTVSQAIGAISFTAGSLIVVELGALTNGSQSAAYLTCSASGLTFAAQASADQVASFKSSARILTALTAGGGSTTITLSSGSQSCFGIIYAVYEVTGQAGSPIGATAAKADNTGDNQFAGTVSGPPASTSVILSWLHLDSDAGTATITDASSDGWTNDAFIDSSGSNFGAALAQQITGVTSTTVVWAEDVRPGGSPAVGSSAGVAVEILVGSTATNAPAENAAGTGAANDATASVSPAAGNAAGTGAANDAVASVSPAAGAVSGTGTANDASAAVSAAAESPSATGTANDASAGVSPAAESASATAAAFDAIVSALIAADVPTASGQAFDATVSISVSAGVASGVGAAYDSPFATSAAVGSRRPITASTATATFTAQTRGGVL